MLVVSRIKLHVIGYRVANPEQVKAMGISVPVLHNSAHGERDDRSSACERIPCACGRAIRIGTSHGSIGTRNGTQRAGNGAHGDEK
jgi:hypothetical protein